MIIKHPTPRLLLFAASAVCAVSIAIPARAGNPSFIGWSSGVSPEEIGKLAAERFAHSPHSHFNPKPLTSITYPESCAWYGALTFARLSGDQALTQELVKRFEPFFGPEAHLIPNPVNVDSTVFCIVPLEIYIETKDPRCLALGLRLADA